MRFNVPSSSMNQAEVRKSPRKNCAYWKQRLTSLAAAITHDAIEYRKAVKEFKDSRDWDEEYKTWGAASRAVLGITPQRSNQLCRELTENYEDDLERGLSEVAIKKELASLKQVEDARLPDPPKEDDGPPRVKTAEESIADTAAKNGEPVVPQAPPKVTENGKPKSQLSIWREMEESLLGRSLNRADELNRLCPNGRLHALLIGQVKACLLTLEQWRASVR